MNQTYFEWYEFDVNAYSLQPVVINQRCSEYEWIRVAEFKYCWFTHTKENKVYRMCILTYFGIFFKNISWRGGKDRREWYRNQERNNALFSSCVFVVWPLFIYFSGVKNRRRHQCPSGEEHLRLFTHIGHEHQECSLKRA